jgi:NitT/TauT family transport system substrate-binding protein
VPGAGSADAIRNILAGPGRRGLQRPGTFFAALDKGEKLRAIYDIYPQNVFNVVSLKGSSITRPADLEGQEDRRLQPRERHAQALQVLLHSAACRVRRDRWSSPGC